MHTITTPTDTARRRSAPARVLSLVTSALLAVGVILGAPAAAQAAAWPVLSSGSTGDDVTTAQYLLRSGGQSIDADGQFGPATGAAVIAFQSSAGLAADGVVGEQTWQALTPTLRQGDTGDAVSAAQVQLGVTVDGQFGPATAEAVREFQGSAGLTADGIIGPDTWRALVAGTDTTPPPPPVGDAAATAQAILDNPGIELDAISDDTASTAPANITDTAAGRPAKTSPASQVGVTEVSLSPQMLDALLRLNTEYGYDLRVTSIAGEVHSATSLHYEGRAVDIASINGVTVVSGNSDYQGALAACEEMGAIEHLGPGDPDHEDHIHCAF